MNMTTTKDRIVKITWKSEDGFQFIGVAENHDWDIVSTTSDDAARMDVGSFVWCKQNSNEDWGIHMEEIPFTPFATEQEWEEQERKYKK